MGNQQNTKVEVLSMMGKLLMPTSQGKASHLLKKGKAKVVKINPFTIQLTVPSGESMIDKSPNKIVEKS